MNRFILSILFCGILQFTFGTTLTIKSGTRIKDDYVADGGESTNTYGKLAWLSWGLGTESGNPVITRAFLRFDLSQIPQNAIINSAVVTLFGDSANGGNVTTGGSNASFFSLVTQDWNDNLVNYNNQPSISTANQVSIAATTSLSQNISADISPLIQYLVNNPGLNYGMCIGLQDENLSLLYRYMHCYSVEYPDSTLWPQIVIDYTMPAPPSPSTGTVTINQNAYIKDDLVASGVESADNYGELPYIEWGVGTVSGNNETSRTFLRFDLSQVPQNAVITSAMLTLYTDTLGSGGQVTTSGTNASYISRVVQDWVDNTMDYNTQPAASSIDSIAIDSSTSYAQAVQVDIANMIQFFVANPDQNYGMMISLQNESYNNPYRSMHTRSVESDSTTKPQLVINYSVGTGIKNIGNDLSVSMYPNPSKGLCTMSISATEAQQNLSADVCDLTGKQVMALFQDQVVSTKMNYNFSTSGLATGLYFVKVYNSNHEVETQKLIVE